MKLDDNCGHNTKGFVVNRVGVCGKKKLRMLSADQIMEMVMGIYGYRSHPEREMDAL